MAASEAPAVDALDKPNLTGVRRGGGPPPLLAPMELAF